MTPINWRDATAKFIADGCGDLPAHRNDDGWTTLWQPSERELEVLRNGGVVELQVIGSGHPPVAVGARPMPSSSLCSPRED